MDAGTPPAIPDEFKIYNSYEEDPKWQRKFSYIWVAFLGACILVSLPSVLRSLRNKRLFTGFFGVREFGNEYSAVAEKPINEPAQSRRSRRGRTEALLLSVASILLWSPPGIELNLGQLIIIVGYVTVVLVCIISQAPLVENSNRAGFLALAQLPVVFLFATKNSIVSLLLGPGHSYTSLNYIHRWSGRCMTLGVIVHGALWIRNHREYGIKILGAQKETSGIAALGLLGVIVLTSIRPVRRFAWEVFFIVHTLAFVAFFITLCYHTIYASPWIFPPLAFYAADLLMRLLRVRIKDATLVPVAHQMTLIRVAGCDAGWLAGQHVRLRVFFSGRVFEAHPLTISTATPDISCISQSDGILLGARAAGDWTKALNDYAQSERKRLVSQPEHSTDEKTALGKAHDDVTVKETRALLVDQDLPEVPVMVMVDGPYGGSSIDLGEYESVLLVSGGSGVTFSLGMLDDIVGRCIRLGRKNGERTRRIEFAWCIRSFGAIQWFASQLMDIAAVAATAGEDLDLHISIFVTCLCDPEAVPSIPNCDVIVERPSVRGLIDALTTPPDVAGDSPRSASIQKEEGELASAAVKSTLRWAGLGGGVAVCASGPESLTREAANAVASVSLQRGVQLGGVGLHTELYAL
ncbi:hypothetical protein HGRIS_007227 [Hohenbuehelia grisea]|uniref:FAD-binding FR-type domain-containing protein n=1 Tax=Hohenbuehelia grisea TaxID=104357 RepID=A0ABR3JC54_9AGAR